jgi:regulator of nucleoside diphosphate kinase
MNHAKNFLHSDTAHRPPLVVLLGDYTQLRGLARDHDLSDELDRAIVVPWERMPRDVVTMHSRCIYIDENVGVQREIELVYPDEADPAEGKVSVLAPIGSALLGVAAGQSIDWELPGGRVHRLRLVRVLHQPDAATDTQTGNQ